MKITLLMATTINGYIAGLDDDTNWIKDTELLYKTIEDFGVVVLGKRTYDECIKYKIFPYKGALNVVMTHNADLLKKSDKNVIFTDVGVNEIATLVKKQGHNQVLLIGGGHVNGSFIKENLIDDIILDIHPYIKAEGIRIFEDVFADINLKLLEFKQINDEILQVKYQVIK